MANSVIDAAKWLFESRLTKTMHDNLPEACYPATAEIAYKVQEQLVARIVMNRNTRTIGYKIGCTNQSIMDLLGADEPFYGRIMDDSTYSSGVRLSASDFTHRIVDAEFMMVMDSDLPDSETPYSAETVKPFIGKLLPAVELVDHRFTDFTKVGINALISDNGIHAASILGEPDAESWKTMDLGNREVKLFVNGTIKETGTGANVLGNPLNAMAWLGNCLQSQGRTLHAGDMITTGAACPVYSAIAGDRILVDYG
ncbi:MAG: hypothetical protein F4X92_05740 [Gammaproteobacteria bacterium]|nr:hypothetical protein [Gammaproteobacteria bacterium]